MTREEVKEMEKWEQHFNWAINSNFVHMSQGEFNEVAAAYKRIMGVGLNASQMTCNTCRLRAMKEFGAEYFKWKKKYENEDKKEDKKEDKPETPKKGRPRKIDLLSQIFNKDA